MKKTWSFSIVIIVTCILGSCATIVSKSSYPLVIRTDPKGAEISIINKKGKEIFRGMSPATTTIKSGAGFFSRARYEVRISSEGYTTQVIPVEFKLNGWYFGNIIFGGFTGLLIIDPLTGAMWKPKTQDVDVVLTRSASAAPTLMIIDIKDVSADMKADLVRIK